MKLDTVRTTSETTRDKFLAALLCRLDTEDLLEQLLQERGRVKPGLKVIKGGKERNFRAPKTS